MSRRFFSANLVWVLLAAGFGLLYGFTLRHTYSADGLWSAGVVERAQLPQLFHPNHFLYAVVSGEFWLLYQKMADPVQAIFFLQYLNACVTAVAVATLGRMIAWRFGWAIGLLAGVFWGGSSFLWSHATDPGWYAWAALASCLLLVLLLNSEKAGAFWVGVGHGMMVLFYLPTLLVAPAFVVRLGQRYARPGPAILRYTAGLGLTVGIPYGLTAFLFHGPSWRFAIEWNGIRLLVWPVVLYLSAWPLSRLPRRWVLTIGILLGGLLIYWNGRYEIRPLRKSQPEVARAEWVGQEAHHPDFLLFAGEGPGSVQDMAMAYFASRVPARSLASYRKARPDGDLLPIRRRAEWSLSRGGRFLVERDLYSKKEKDLAPLWSAFRVDKEFVGPEDYRLVSLRPKKTRGRR